MTRFVRVGTKNIAAFYGLFASLASNCTTCYITNLFTKPPNFVIASRKSCDAKYVK